MADAWTPGPWLVDDMGCISADNDGLIAIPNGERNNYGWYREEGREGEEQANALLMSLAPEMAALLQRVAASDPTHRQFAVLVMIEVREMLERLPGGTAQAGKE